MWRADGAKRSRNDYFLVIKKLTSPMGFDRKCLGKWVSFASFEGHVCFCVDRQGLQRQIFVRMEKFNKNSRELEVFDA